MPKEPTYEDIKDLIDQLTVPNRTKPALFLNTETGVMYRVFDGELKEIKIKPGS